MASSYERPAWVEVDPAAISSNIAALKALLRPGVGFMAVVKANAYGHGMVPVARFALDAGADRLGVALLDEAEELRRSGIPRSVPVQTLGELPVEGAERAIAGGIDVTTGRRQTIDALSGAAASLGVKARLHLKVDTGMHRIGCAPGEALDLARRVESDENLVLAGVMTHFATSEEPEGETFLGQLGLWREVRRSFDEGGIRPEAWHSANSGAAILTPETHDDLVRCGISIYGLHPGPATRRAIALTPALSLLARASEVKCLGEGEGVSYGHAWHAPAQATVATLPLGYGDGYSRRLSNLAEAGIRGQRGNVVGHVTMDQTMVLVPPGVDLEVGETVELIGRLVTVDDLAALLGTINYEITCMLNPRLPRRYLGQVSGNA